MAQVRRRLTPPTATTPPAQAPSGSREGFDWQRFLGGVLGSRIEGGRTPGVIPDRYRPPGGFGPMPPGYVPDYGRFRPPREVIRVPGNVVETERVQPQPNEIVVPQARIPQQFSPLEGRVWEVSVREARCYAIQFERLVNESLALALPKAEKGDAEALALQGLVDQIRELMARNAPWREVEPIARELVEGHQEKFSGEVLEQLQRAMRMLVVRDAFRLVGESAPRGREPAFSVTAIPRGVIWIVFDPTLAPGTALVVTDQVIVCGGGSGELYVIHTSVAEALGLPVGRGAPVPDVEEEAVRGTSEAVVIRNREDASVSVNFVLNERQPHTLPPGRSLDVPANQKWVIEFDRGGGSGTARYGLAQGVYEFRVVDQHWDLVKLKFEVTIDNREGPQDFVYVMNNEVVTVPAGEAQTHVDSEPIVVEFDRGAGPEAPARKNLNKSGTYKVAVNTDSNYLDLFSEEADTG